MLGYYINVYHRGRKIYPIKINTFSNNEIKSFDTGPLFEAKHSELVFKWESDKDLISLLLFKKLNPEVNKLVILYMPYSRMDRDSSLGSKCSLRYIGEFIQSLNFSRIEVVDSHSDLTCAYLGENSHYSYPFNSLPNRYDVIFYPDAGAKKRYSNHDIFKNIKSSVGNKVRDLESNRIISYEISSMEYFKKVLIVDDLCSYGGTFYEAAKKIKEAYAAETIDLLVSHCEDSIYNGELLKESSPINTIYTTDSLLSCSHPKIVLYKKFFGD